jgi:NAD(P)-dependent dehydrogenase (short-subunit alcohol dehydrogenase family)
MSEIRTATKKIDAVDMLILTQGILNMAGRTPTTENIDDKLALNYYGRVLFVNELLLLLRSSPHSGKILFVLNSKQGNPSKINWNDMPLENTYSLSAAFNHGTSFTNLVIQHLAAQPENKNITFMHAYPALVQTQIDDSLPFYVRLPFNSLMPIGFGVTPEDCAEYMIHGMMETENGWRCFYDTGETVRNKKESSTEFVEKVREHTSQIIYRNN